MNTTTELDEAEYEAQREAATEQWLANTWLELEINGTQWELLKTLVAEAFTAAREDGALAEVPQDLLEVANELARVDPYDALGDDPPDGS